MEARLAQWWEYWPSTNVAQVCFPDTPRVGWVCWFSILSWEVLRSLGTVFLPSHQKLMFHLVFFSILVKPLCSIISNSNWIEWSTIQGVIGQVISKLAECEAQGQFEITSTITPWIVRHEVQWLINRNYNKIWEEYDSGINYLTGWYIQLT